MENKITFLTPILLILILSSCGVSPGTQNRETSDYARAEKATEKSVSQRLVQLTNAHRAKLGRSKLTHDSNLKALAMEHSTYIANNHKGNSSIRDFAHAGEVVRIKYSQTLGENVAWHSGSSAVVADKLFQTLLASKSHRKAIEQKNWKWMGVSVVQGNTGYYYATQLFARPYIKPAPIPQMIFL